MPTSADRVLIQRDTALPGLALLLDPQVFIAELALWFPEWKSARGHITYLRYKPGQSCLVGYRLELNGASHHWHAKAHRPQAKEKLAKYRDLPTKQGLDGTGFTLLDNLGLAIGQFPLDRKLKVLTSLADSTRRRALLEESLPNAPGLWASTSIETLRYKPERRYVAYLYSKAGEQALLKACTSRNFAQTLAGNRAFRSQGQLRVPRVLGQDRRHHLFIGEWMRGQPLDRLIQHARPDLQNVGAALVELHRQQPQGLACRSRHQEIHRLRKTTQALGKLQPESKDRLDGLTSRLTERLRELPESYRAIHGDLHIEQVLLDGENVVLIDFDQAAYADPYADLGSFIAQLDCMVIKEGLDNAKRDYLTTTLLAGYRRAGGEMDSERLSLYTAYGLLMRSLEPFRQRWKDWPTQTERLLTRAEEILASALQTASCTSDITSIDPAMPCMAQALNIDFMQSRLAALFDKQQEGTIKLEDARLLRHKPGRRCLIEYRFGSELPTATSRPWLGKIRAKGLDGRSFELQSKLYARGFNEQSPDGIAVPRPIGMLPELNMWLQEKIPGEVATDQWHGARGIELAARVAEAIHKLHRAPITPYKNHFIDDELAILRRRLTDLARHHEWRERILAVLQGCEVLAGSMTPSPACGIHRDFYPDQVLVGDKRLYLLDLDLYCLGDPALDIGNFIAHMMEQALRTQDDIEAFNAPQRALVSRFLALNSAVRKKTLQGYITLSLARHIAISTQFPDRNRCTKPLIEHCEKRLETSYA